MNIFKVWNQKIKKYFSLDWKKNQYKLVIDVIDKKMVILVEKDGLIVGSISFADMQIASTQLKYLYHLGLSFEPVKNYKGEVLTIVVKNEYGHFLGEISQKDMIKSEEIFDILP